MSLSNELHCHQNALKTKLTILLFEKKKKKFSFGCARSSLLCGLFSSCSEQGVLFTAVCGLLIVGASLAAEHRLLGGPALAAAAQSL